MKTALILLAAYFVGALVWLAWAGVFGWMPKDSIDARCFFFLVHLLGAAISISWVTNFIGTK